MHTLLLFDVDGVLIDPKGYKYALRDTVNYFATQMGLPPINLTLEEIAIFEANGMTNEWDSAAFSLGLLLATALKENAQHWQPTFEETFTAIKQAKISIQRPDFEAYAKAVSAHNVEHDVPTKSCLAVIKSLADPFIYPLFDVLFNDIYALDTPTTRIQQIHTIGSQYFEQTYQETALFSCQSYLMDYDTPLLSEENRDALLAWHKHPDHDFVIYTARPSLPPSDETVGYPPEADLAAELLGLNGKVPLIAAGRMEWIARQYQLHASEYIKPSPVQALAAIGAAFSGEEIPALEAAALFDEEDELISPLMELTEIESRIIVFEDSTGGIRAVQGAVDLLQKYGAEIDFHAVGVSPDDSKRQALLEVTDWVVDTVNDALSEII